MNSDPHAFWREALAVHGSATPKVLPDVGRFGLIALLACGTSRMAEMLLGIELGLAVAPFEIIGAALGLLLILRTNAGYDRWWEARKLWGGIVNQSRNIAISGMAYGPKSVSWRSEFVGWVATFPHVARSSLRQDPVPQDVSQLISREEFARLSHAGHGPSYVAWHIARLLREACETQEMDRFAFMQIDKERTQLIDHIGACERILRTPLPLVYSIKIRRFIFLFLITLPFVLIHRLQTELLVPVITMLVAYPLLSLDRIGTELQNPFAVKNLSHLPLTDIAATIEQNVIRLNQETLSPNDQSSRAPLDGQNIERIQSGVGQAAKP